LATCRGQRLPGMIGPTIKEAGVIVLPWGFVLLDNVGGDAAAAAERDALSFARARMPALRSQLAVVRPSRRCLLPALWACSR